MNRRQIGLAAETSVAAWYAERSYQLLERNVRVGPLELDLILERGRLVVFCEVRYRSTVAFGYPVETINAQKRLHLRNAALGWLTKNELRRPIRFDVASVTGNLDRASIEVLENAF